ncbi:hypothetical protein REC12_11865 [Desulfosporosinus sp. PR]|uniref:hypothetical protein n=1 Tax=Candidatus Desulfosporosinus nitrosoreducens TaxID=3401928 RepID=UPI0027FAD3A4|nr:hypothetical protein [Desulfosporosinus sp. PR]MDQ7094286.1 hypothetical protein [Desulfosporosinus sp. PR]
MEIMKVTPQEATNIINTKLPIGLYRAAGVLNTGSAADGIYIAIDNSDGNALVKQFTHIGDCMQWLRLRKNQCNQQAQKDADD